MATKQKAPKTAPATTLQVVQVDEANKAAATLADNVVNALRADGSAFYEADANLKAFAVIMRPFMVTATQAGDYARYIEASRQWRIGYEQAKRNTQKEDVALSDMSQKAWERHIKEARSEDLLGDDRLQGDIPKSVNPEAVRKAAARAAAQQAIANAIGSASLVELGRKETQAASAAKAAMKKVEAANAAAAKAQQSGDEVKAQEAALKLAKAREEAKAAEEARATAALHAETKAAQIKKAEAEAEAAKLKQFRERARQLIANAPLSALTVIIAAMEKAGVKTADEIKAANAEQAKAAQAKADAAALEGKAPV